MRLALAIILTIPAVLCGVLLMLLLTDTTLNVQSFMGAIMAMGIAVANSILLITFAERSRHEGHAVMDATREAPASRLRAILMTAAAMILGMLPMAIGIGEQRVSGGATRPRGDRRADRRYVRNVNDLAVHLLDCAEQGCPSSPSLNPLDPESRYYEAT